MHLEGLSEVSKGQDLEWRCTKPSTYQRLPGIHPSTHFSFLTSCIVPRDLIIEGTSNFSITLNKTSMVASECLEASQFCDHDGNRQVPDSFDVMHISADTLL